MSFLLALLAATAGPVPARPVPPTIAVLNPADCEQPESRKRLIAIGPSGGLAPSAANTYNEQWADYLEARTTQLGLTAQERKEFGQAILASPEFDRLQQANIALFDRLMKAIDRGRSSKDEMVICQTMAEVNGLLREMLVNSEKQFMAMDRMIDEQAAKKGSR